MSDVILLDECIEKYRRAYRYGKRQFPDWSMPGETGRLGSKLTCVLCKRFHSNYCNGCPIADYTGESWCYGTPLQQAYAIDAFQPRSDNKLYRRCAKKMYDFLIKVREAWCG